MNSILTSAATIALCLSVAACNSDVVVAPLDPKSGPLEATVPATRVTIATGDSIKLIPVDKIANARGVSWTSSNTAVVRVSTSGWAFGEAAGTASVSAMAKATTQRWIIDVTQAAPP